MSKICHVMPGGVSPCYYVTLYITLERVRYRKKEDYQQLKPSKDRQTDGLRRRMKIFGVWNGDLREK